MKKYGKHENRPEAVIKCRERAPKSQAKIKGTLLQTYFTSLLSLILCVGMFFGTSYAWFTSEVNNIGNEIYIGTLDAGLFKLEGEEEHDLAGSGNKLFDSNIRWEPGYTALETVKIVNEGDLAFKYVLSFTESAPADGAEAVAETPLGNEAAQYFDVWVFAHGNGEAPAPASYADITAADSGWVNVGSLDELFSGETVLSGVMDAVRKAAQETAEGTTDIIATAHTYTIALHMNEEASADVMRQKISLDVKLVAYQMGSEKDDFGSKYDQMVASADELSEALENGGTVALAADITLTEGVSVPADVVAVLDLNSHTITYVPGDAVCAVKNEGTLTIEGDGTIQGSYSALYSTGNLTVNGGTFTATEGFGLLVDNIYGTEPSVAVINGGTFTGVGIYNPTEVTINGGVFNIGDDPDGACDDVTLFISPTFVGVPNTATVTLNGGTFNGDIYVYDDGITETEFVNNGATITGAILDNN